jgi:hypothetical protein
MDRRGFFCGLAGILIGVGSVPPKVTWITHEQVDDWKVLDHLRPGSGNRSGKSSRMDEFTARNHKSAVFVNHLYGRRV